MSSHHHGHRLVSGGSGRSSMLVELWDSFWNPPDLVCPKCGSDSIEYYDPFFFSPIRTVQGRRRVRCLTCRFIWRPSRRKKALWKGFRPFI